jgi:hypothetical protein
LFWALSPEPAIFFQRLWNKSPAFKVSLARRRQWKSQSSKMAKRRRKELLRMAPMHQEISMYAYLKAPMALAFILAIPLFARPALGGPAHDTGSKPAHHRVADFAQAKAYVSPVTPVWRAPQTDGLSRNAEECSRGGCIDN